MLATALGDFASSLVSIIWSTPLFLLLLGCGLIYTIATKFVQWRVLTHGFDCVRGKYDDPNDPGAISHFQALCAALSATVGLGNIAGVAVAVSLGGPGAVFWMWIVGLFGMALKYAECSLAVMYRDVRDVPDPSAPALMESDAESRTLEYEGEAPPEPGAVSKARGEVRGGPMWYIQRALVDPLQAKSNPLWMVFKLLAVLFAISAMLNSFGGGNMFQGWNVSNVLAQNFGVPQTMSAAVVSILVAMVIIGGIKRIGAVASKLVPIMCAAYVIGASFIIITNAGDIPKYLSLIVTSALNGSDGEGAFVGVGFWMAFTWGLKRACFSNEAGEGSAAIAHSAAKTDEPIREGVVAGMGPLIDTLIICTMSALVILMSGAWNRPTVGKVTEIADNDVIVTINENLPDDVAEQYLRELTAGCELSVILNQTPGEASTSVDLKPRQLPESQSLSEVSTIALKIPPMDEDDPDKTALLAQVTLITPGQPVHIPLEGAEMMRFAFDSGVYGMGKWIISIGVCLFAFSTMISWSYYGEKGAEYLFGPGSILIYKLVFVVFVFLGMVLPKFSTVYDFSDATTGMMVLCNLPAVLILLPKLITASKDYFARLDSGEIKPYR